MYWGSVLKLGRDLSEFQARNLPFLMLTCYTTTLLSLFIPWNYKLELFPWTTVCKKQQQQQQQQINTTTATTNKQTNKKTKKISLWYNSHYCLCSENGMNNKWQTNNYMNYKNIKKEHQLNIFSAQIICIVAINKSVTFFM